MNWAYLLRCADGSLYAGWTNDLDKRLAAHNAGAGGKYTRSHRPVALAWARAYPTRSEAMAQEARLKRMTRAEKLELVAGWELGGETCTGEVAGETTGEAKD